MTTHAVLISDQGVQHHLEDTLTIGREEDNTIVLKNDRVSRHHAKIALDDGKITLEDLGSSNGTRCNGERVSGTLILNHGDVVSIGPFSLTLELAGQKSASAADGNATILDQGTAAEGTAAPAESPASGAGAHEAPLPGSWVESDDMQSTQFFQRTDDDAVTGIERHGDLPQLLLLDSLGGVASVFHLEIGAEDEDVWEIGRQAECDVAIDDSTVSARHAQLVHTAGRWRIVNLVSSNGIVVNGEKRLAVYLTDGDLIQLGSARLAFFGDANAQPGTTRGAAPRESESAAAGGGHARLWLMIGAAVLVLAGLAGLFLTR